MQYHGNAAWYGVGVNRWSLGNHPSSMLYLLARPPLTQHDLKKSKIALALYGRPFLPKLSSCYCALHFSIVPCHGGTTKKWGTVKRIFPALCAGICAPHFWSDSGAIVCNRKTLRREHWSFIWDNITCYIASGFYILLHFVVAGRTCRPIQKLIRRETSICSVTY